MLHTVKYIDLKLTLTNTIFAYCCTRLLILLLLHVTGIKILYNGFYIQDFFFGTNFTDFVEEFAYTHNISKLKKTKTN